VPLIRHIRSAGHEVLFAGDHSQQAYITGIFPGISCLFLEGYGVQYAVSRRGFMPKLLSQLPRIRRQVRAEQAWLEQLIRTQQVDGVISDNRYGLFSPQVPSVLLTHQLQVLSGLGGAADRMVQKWHYRFIERFGECWVVDTAGAPGLSGILAHPSKLPAIPVRYLGLLSQCAGAAKPAGPGNYLLVFLSGAEPQRSILSAQLWKQALMLGQPLVFVEGSEKAVPPVDIPAHVCYYKRVVGSELQDLVAGASLVLCRSGYSSLMDLAALQQKAILIPTPGQTEQEYLARHLQQQGMQLSGTQQGLDLAPLLAQASAFPYRQMAAADSFTRYAAVLERWLKQL
jgi:hypothetical protein